MSGVFFPEVFENFNTHSMAGKSLKQVTTHLTTRPLCLSEKEECYCDLKSKTSFKFFIDYFHDSINF
jgi:hypothetical protein